MMTRLQISVSFVLLIFANVKWIQGEKLSENHKPNLVKSEEVAMEKMLIMESNLKSGVEYLIKKAMPTMLRMSTEVEVSGECVGSLFKMINGLRDLKLWAFQMLDATAKPGSGILRGNLAHFGSYQQCMSVVIPQQGGHRKTNDPPETGQFCALNIDAPLPPKPYRLKLYTSVFSHVNVTVKSELMSNIVENLFYLYEFPFKFAVCIPSKCSVQDLDQLVSLVAEQIGVRIKTDACQVPEKLLFDNTQIIIISMIMTFVVTCVAATAFVEYNAYRSGNEAYENKSKSYWYQILLSFSIIVNWRKLMEIKPTTTRSLDCLYGVQFLSVSWVVLGHSFVVTSRPLIDDLIRIDENRKTILFTTCNAFLAATSVIFLTGVLVAHITVNYFQSNNSFNPLKLLLKRILRILPGIVLVTGLSFLLSLISSGPEFKLSLRDRIDICKKYWWMNFLFIGNFVNFDKMCMPHMFYFSVDIQLFVIGAIYFWLLFRNPKYGFAFLVLCISASIITTGIITYVMDLPPAFLYVFIDLDFLYKFVQISNFQAHYYLGAYAVGLFLGTYLARNPELKIPKLVAVAGWMVAITSFLLIQYSTNPWNNGELYSPFEAIAYSSLYNTAWALCLAWIVLACHTGMGSYANGMLTWPVFQPLAKLSFQVYLIHYLVLLVYEFSRQNSIPLSHENYIYKFLGTWCISHILALPTKLFYEAPLTQIVKMILPGLSQNTEDKKIVSNDKIVLDRNLKLEVIPH